MTQDVRPEIPHCPDKAKRLQFCDAVVLFMAVESSGGVGDGVNLITMLLREDCS